MLVFLVLVSQNSEILCSNPKIDSPILQAAGQENHIYIRDVDKIKEKINAESYKLQHKFTSKLNPGHQ